MIDVSEQQKTLINEYNALMGADHAGWSTQTPQTLWDSRMIEFERAWLIPKRHEITTNKEAQLAAINPLGRAAYDALKIQIDARAAEDKRKALDSALLSDGATSLDSNSVSKNDPNWISRAKASIKTYFGG